MAPSNHLPRRRRGRQSKMARVVWIGRDEINLDALAKIAEDVVVADIRADAAAGRQGDDTPTRQLTEAYKRRKAREWGAVPAANFRLTGKLLKSLGPRARRLMRAGAGMASGIRITVTVSNARFKQLVGLASRGRRLLGVSRSDVREIAEALTRGRKLYHRGGRQR